MDQMKILMVAPTPFFADRGCHARILGEARALKILGHEVVIATYPLGRDIPDVKTVRTWPVPWYKKLSAGPSWHKYYIDLMLLSLVRGQIQSWRPDIIHAHLHEGACIARLAAGRKNIPVLLDYQGSLTQEVVAHGFTNPKSVHYKILSRIEEWIETKVDGIVTSTQHSATRLIHKHPLLKDRIHPLPDAVDTTIFRPGLSGMNVRAKFGIPSGIPLVLYAGSLNSYQGIDLMLKAFAKIKSRKQFHALIIGYPQESYYQEMAKSLGLSQQVTFTGRIPFDQLPFYLSAAKIALSPKLSETEGNEKLHSYMASGLATVLFDSPANREIAGDTALFAEKMTADSLAQSLENLLDNQELQEKLSRHARQRAEQYFDWAKRAEDLNRIYTDILKTSMNKWANACTMTV
ncbi:MAG: glycosyltransferase family 4 protein [Candidatus Omnitrophica bacterium]|nr:glycosyltransferase family 4 protein [Candidatus Omnitrophota bacterium]